MPELTDSQRLRLCQSADGGSSVRSIAAELGCAPSTVARAAKHLGVVFDRSATAAATAARGDEARAVAGVLAMFAAEAVRLAAVRDVPDGDLSELLGRHLLRAAGELRHAGACALRGAGAAVRGGRRPLDAR